MLDTRDGDSRELAELGYLQRLDQVLLRPPPARVEQSSHHPGPRTGRPLPAPSSIDRRLRGLDAGSNIANAANEPSDRSRRWR